MRYYGAFSAVKFLPVFHDYMIKIGIFNVLFPGYDLVCNLACAAKGIFLSIYSGLDAPGIPDFNLDIFRCLPALGMTLGDKTPHFPYAVKVEFNK